MTQDPETTAVGLLVLARLLPAGDAGATRAQILKDLRPFVPETGDGAAGGVGLDRTLGELEAGGLIRREKRGRCAATPEGRRRGLMALGIDELPPRTTWAKVKNPYLVARALGLPAPAGEAAKRLSQASGFKAELIRAGYRVDAGDRASLKQATDALAWTLMGMEPGRPFTTKNVQEALFRRELGDPSAKKPLDMLLARGIGARRADLNELRDAAVRAWAAETAAEPASPPAAAPADRGPSDLGVFARRVVEAARTSPTGRFGGDKVFIAHAWRAVRDDPSLGGMDLDAFKRRLAEANQARLLDLSRADLVEAMDREDVETSEARHLGATFHFLHL